MTAIRMIDCRLRNREPRPFGCGAAERGGAERRRWRWRGAAAGAVAAGHRRAAEAAGTSRSAPHRGAGTAHGSVRSAVPAASGRGIRRVAGSGGGVSPPLPTRLPGRCGGASSPARFCLISETHWVNADHEPALLLAAAELHRVAVGRRAVIEPSVPLFDTPQHASKRWLRGVRCCRGGAGAGRNRHVRFVGNRVTVALAGLVVAGGHRLSASAGREDWKISRHVDLKVKW